MFADGQKRSSKLLLAVHNLTDCPALVDKAIAHSTTVPRNISTA
jgi:hypothetical protein